MSARPAPSGTMPVVIGPGGAFVTLYSEDGEQFGPHVSGCFLDVVEGERGTCRPPPVPVPDPFAMTCP